MSQKTLFGYQSVIRSSEVSRAISIPPGVGPIFGYGSGVVDNSTGVWKVLIYPNYYGDTNAAEGVIQVKDTNYKRTADKYIRPIIRDLVNSHNIQVESETINNQGQSNNQGSSGIAKFGLITRDGHLLYDDTDHIEVEILNADTFGNNGPAEVAVFAIHNNIEENVESEVTYMAFPNINAGSKPEGTYSGISSDYSGIKTFYDLFRVSADAYTYKDISEPNFGLDNIASETNNFGDLKLNYSKLLGYVRSILGNAVTIPIDGPDVTLVGVYGVGNYQDENGNTQLESFSIVPYGGKWPYDIPFSLAMLNGIAKNFNFLRGLMEGFPFTETNGGTVYNNIKGYIDDKISEIANSLQSQHSALIPSGLICLWDNADNIPEGWSVYNDAGGRIVIGFVSGNGLTLGTGQVQIQSPGQTYGTGSDDDWRLVIKGTDLPAHTHAIAVFPWGMEDDGSASSSRDNFIPADWSAYNFTSSVTSGGGWKNNSMSQTSWDSARLKGNAFGTSKNLTKELSNTNVENLLQTKDEITLNKAFPMIALIYIKKD